MCNDKHKEWSKQLLIADWWYNTRFHTIAELTPYEIIHSQPVPVHMPYNPGESRAEVMDRALQRREAMIQILKFHLMKAQHMIKIMA